MLILNFSHPITDEQRAHISELASVPINDIRTIPVQINQAQTLEPQVCTVVDGVRLTPHE